MNEIFASAMADDISCCVVVDAFFVGGVDDTFRIVGVVLVEVAPAFVGSVASG